MKTRGFRHVSSRGSPKMSPVKPHLSSGMQNMSFRRPEVITGFAAEARKTHENAWFSQHSEKNNEKRTKAGMKNKVAARRTDKREKCVKTHGFRRLFEERAHKNHKKEARKRGLAAPKTCESTWFSHVFRKKNV